MLRPKGKRKELRTALIAGRVTESVKQAFQELCARTPTTESDAVAQLVERELEAWQRELDDKEQALATEVTKRKERTA